MEKFNNREVMIFSVNLLECPSNNPNISIKLELRNA
jgi:hypothetical protein